MTKDEITTLRKRLQKRIELGKEAAILLKRLADIEKESERLVTEVVAEIEKPVRGNPTGLGCESKSD